MEKVDILFSEAYKYFDDENKRKVELSSKAEKMIGYITFISGAQIFYVNKISQDKSQLLSTIFIVYFLFLCASYIYFITSMSVKKYKSFPEKSEILNLFNEPIESDGIKKSIALMYLNAKDYNSKVNNERANKILIGTILFLISFVVSFSSTMANKIGAI